MTTRRGGFPTRGMDRRGNSSFFGAGASSVPQFPLRSINELLNAPAWQNQPCLHPDKKDGALWFSIDNVVKYDIKKAFTNDYEGPWWNLGVVPQEQQDKWWSDFVQRYYWEPCYNTLVKVRWTKQLRRMISNNISKGKINNVKPKFFSPTCWKMMWEHWDTEKAIHVSKTNSKNRKSDRGGDGMHQHISGSKPFARTKYELTIESGEELAIVDLLRKTRMRKDGTYVDKRAKKIVEEVETMVLSQPSSNNTEDGCHQESNSQAPTTLMKDQAFFKIVQPNKGRLYGLGTSQMEHDDSTEPPAIVLPRQARLERDMINLTDVVKLMSQQLLALTQAAGITVAPVPGAEQQPSPSQQPPTAAAATDASADLSPSTCHGDNEQVNIDNMQGTTFDSFFDT